MNSVFTTVNMYCGIYDRDMKTIHMEWPHYDYGYNN